MHPISGLQEKAYSQFQNEPSGPPQSSITIQPQSNISAEEQKQIAENVMRTKKLAIVEMVASVIVLVCGIVATTTSATAFPWYYMGANVVGTNIWAPVLGIITAGLGLGALKYGDYSRGCLLVAHFVMCIISAKAYGILIIFTSICLASSPAYGYRSYGPYGYDDDGPSSYQVAAGFVITAQAFILIGTLINFISFIVSSAFICRYWCGRKSNAGMTVVYIPTQMTAENGQMQAVSLPQGTQVIFVQSNNQTQNQVPVQAVVP